MNKLLILSGTTNQAYGRSVASVTKNTGLTTDILNAGCVGIYGLVGTDATTAANNGKNCLIGDSGTTGVITGSDFLAGGGDFVQIVQGTATSTAIGTPIATHIINPRRVTKVSKQSYTTPVNEVSFLGWNGAAGSLNLPSITQGAQGTLLSVAVEQNATLQIRSQEAYDTGVLQTTDAGYSIASKIVTAMNSSSGFLTHKGFVTGNGSQADFTGTATAILYTKDSTTAQFMIESATGYVASTGTVAAGDVIGVAHSNMKSVTFTANILGTGAGRHLVYIGGTVYNVADAGSAANNATAIATAINAGSQATATSASVSDVTIVLNPSSIGAKILVVYSADDSAWSTATLTVNTTTGDVVPTLYKAAAAVTGAASFELDRPYRGETGYYLGLSSTVLGTGIVTSTTEWGIKMVVLIAGEKYEYAKQGVLQYSTLTQREVAQAVSPSYGIGTGTQIAELEKLNVVYRGQIDTLDTRVKQLPRFAVASVNYDVYDIQYSTLNDRDALEQSAVNLVSTSIAVPKGHAGQTVLETVLKATFTSATYNF